MAVIVLVFLLINSVAGFPGRWQATFATVVASITLVMLFVIQHTQYRHQIALQLKRHFGNARGVLMAVRW